MASASFNTTGWTIFAEGDARPIDEEEVRRALPILFAPGERHEIRAIADDGEVWSRFVSSDAPDEAIKAIGALDGTIYFILNPVRRDARISNAKTVTHRRWMLIDIDPNRPADASATEAEKAEAAKLVDAILADLGSVGWPAPVIADSGNGWHMLYRIDLPNDRTVHGLVKNCLHALAKRHDTAAAHVDTIVHDAPRPCKLPGSWARKGPDTADRPHRRARILYVPDPLEIVSADQIKALAGLVRDKKPVEPIAPAPTAPVDPWLVRASESSSLHNYVASAIQRECAAVAMAPAHFGNDALNKAAFNLGTMADWPEIASHGGADGVKRLLADATLSRGPRGDHETEKTIRSGWEAGKASPRQRPEPKAAKAAADAHAQAEALKDKRPIKYAAEVKVRKIEFLWPGRIPLGKLTTFAGHGGLGKTFVLCDIAARISQGLEWPLAAGECATPGDVLFISGEDDESDTLVPRLMACGADLNRVAFLSDDFSDVFTLVNLISLTKAVEALDSPRLIVIDPPTNYLEGVDDHKNSELRSRVLRPLATFASKFNVAIVLNNHVNKSSGKDVEAACRVMGSVAWVNGVRTAFLFVRDDQDPDKVVIATIKTNVGRYPKAITYKIVPLENDADMARVEWGEEQDGNADQIGKATTAGATAAEWLTTIFRERREWPSDEIFQAARELGIKRHALFETNEVKRLPIKKSKRVTADGVQYWVWVAKDGWPPSTATEEGKDAPGPTNGHPANTDAIDKLSKPF